ncbi:purine-binding chemotaxis protein CheW, partial [Candidatus Calescamantes bacterium]|nr:purine-binding chemotaxis protein CheW [Candidatus Calescamantes bacterium]
MKSVSFRLGDQLFGFDIMKVKEIVKEFSLKSVPGVNPIITGFMNLRGEIITVLDLRKRLSMDALEEGSSQDVIIVLWREEKYGLVIDEVLEVVELSEDEINRENKNIFRIEEDFVYGLGKVNDKPIMILSLEKVLEFYEQILSGPAE